MGTRADFYVGRGEQAEWLGSIAWDGYPNGIDAAILKARTDRQFRNRVGKFLGRDDATLPAQGWPWPWETSHTTDYAYAFDGDKTWASCFGDAWFDPLLPQPDQDGNGNATVFPNMKSRANVQFSGPKSGLIVVSARGVE